MKAAEISGCSVGPLEASMLHLFRDELGQESPFRGERESLSKCLTTRAVGTSREHKARQGRTGFLKQVAHPLPIYPRGS